MSGARERLIEAGAEACWVDGITLSDLHPEDLEASILNAGDSLDAFLAHPDDLIECLVEAGALHSWQHEAEGPGQTGRVHYERVNTATSEGGTE